MDNGKQDEQEANRMRISELSRRSGVSIPTIKYYLRDGLLPPAAPRPRTRPSTTRTTCAGCG